MAKVMLVEDDNNLREIYEARLQAEGYTIVSAHDGEEALVVAKAEMPDLIISDVMMPKISGFEMLDILRNTDGLKDVKVIMLTALGQSDDQQRADKLGANRYLVKSQVTLEDIVKTTHDLLGDVPSTEPAAPAAPAASATPSPTPAAAAPTPTPTPEATPTVSAKPSAAPAPADPTPKPTASPEPPTPATPAVTPTPPPAPAQPVPPPPTAAVPTSQPTTAPTINDAATVDDKVMADAVDKLIADTSKSEPKAPEAAAPDTAKKEEEEPTKEKAEDEDPNNSNVKIANKKIIKPIDSSHEKDINELLAEEEAKEMSSAAGNVTKPATKVDDQATTAAEEAAVDAKIEDFVAGATSEPDAPIKPPADEPLETSQTTPGSENTSQDTPAPAAEPDAPAKPPTATPSQSSVQPIVISDEDAPSGAPASSLSGNPGVPPAPSGDGTTSSDPNAIAL